MSVIRDGGCIVTFLTGQSTNEAESEYFMMIYFLIYFHTFDQLFQRVPLCEDEPYGGRRGRAERHSAEFPFYTFNAFYVSPFTFVFQLIKAVLMRKITCPHSPSEFLLAGLDTKGRAG